MTRRTTTIEYLIIEFFTVGILSSLYLLVFDRVLQTLAPLHWAILLAYIVIAAVLFAITRANGARLAYLGLGAISALMVLAMIADAALGLPFSKAHVANSAGLGWSYLFGFGAAGTGSTFAVSFAFTLMLVSLAILAALSYARSRRA